MAGITLGGAQSDVRQGGQVVLLQIFETFAGSSQGAPASSVTIGITAAPGLSGGSAPQFPRRRPGSARST